MESTQTRQIHSVDTWRIFAAFLVVTVHFPLSDLVGEIAIT